MTLPKSAWDQTFVSKFGQGMRTSVPALEHKTFRKPAIRHPQVASLGRCGAIDFSSFEDPLFSFPNEID